MTCNTTPILGIVLCIALGGPSGLLSQEVGFILKDSEGSHLDVLLNGRLVARYMYAHDTSTPERRLETYKPYLHVFDADGETALTKGPGGQYTHHRGIFIGWNKLGFGGKTYDRWHMKGGEIVHQKFLKTEATKDHATITSLTHWNDNEGKAMVVEERTMTVRRAPKPARVVVDFTSKLGAPNGEVQLKGDPEHAGIQYRPADEVVRKETRYVFPKDDANPKADLDYPWVGETYTLGGKRYSVVQLNAPTNPKGTKFSAYRDYGRFGAFFEQTIPSGDSLTVKYRFVIADGEMPPKDFIERCWKAYAGS